MIDSHTIRLKSVGAPTTHIYGNQGPNARDNSRYRWIADGIDASQKTNSVEKAPPP